MLEKGPIQPKYYLSPRACEGILRRAERRGKKLPEPLRAALESVAASESGGGIASPLTAREGKGPDSDATSGNLVPDVAGPLGASGPGGWGHDLDRMGAFIPETAATLTSGGHPDSAIPGRHREDDVNLVVADVAATLGTSEGHTPRGQAAINLIAFDPTQLTHRENRSKCEPGAPSPALAARARAPHLAAFTITPESGQGSDLRAAAAAVSTALTATEKKKHERGVRIVEGATVRRLTPRECERLQGFPDDWTLVPAEGGKPETSDAQRYEVVGNSVAVPVVEYIGRRLLAFVTEERTKR